MAPRLPSLSAFILSLGPAHDHRCTWLWLGSGSGSALGLGYPKCTPRSQAMRTEMLGLVDGLSAYHLLRGTTVEKMTKAPSKSTDEETKVSPDPDPDPQP